MPLVERLGLRMDVVYWPYESTDENGDIVVGDPVSIKARYELGRTESLDPQGHTIALDAKLHTDLVIPINSVVFLGKLVDATDTAEKMIVKTNGVVPDVRIVSRLYTVGLMRHNNAAVPTA